MKELKKKALTPNEAAEMYGIPAGSLANLRCRREGPKFYKVGRKVLYLLEEFEAWLRMNPVLTKDALESWM